MEIYVLIDNQPDGPYTPELIRQYLNSGQFQPTDLGAYAGCADWKPLSEMVRSWETQAPSKGTRVSGASAVPKKTTRAKPVLALMAVVLVLLAGVGGFVGWRIFGNSGPEVKVITPAEPGLPNTVAELNGWYAEPPEGQNAATFFLKGFEAIQISDVDRNSRDVPLIGKGAMPAVGSPLPPKTRAAIAALMQRNKAAMEAFQEGSKFEQSRYPMDLSQGYDTLLPHLAKIKQSAQLGVLNVLLLADGKQSQAATDSLLTSLAGAQSLKNEPVGISQLVRVACLAIERANLEYVVNSVVLPPTELDRLSVAFAKAESEESIGTPFTRSRAGERATVLSVFDLPRDKLEAMLKKASGGRPGESDQSDESAPQSLALKQLTRNSKSQRAFAEETFNRSIVMRKQPFPERLKAGEYFTSRIAEAKSNEFHFCLLFIPALGREESKEASTLAGLRVAQTAIALDRYRTANSNHYPATLNELTPTFLSTAPQDPFDGQLLRYKKNGDGYELSSIGADPAKPITFKVVKPPG
jgi:hypothetical protein